MRPQANIIRRLMLIRHVMRSHGRRHPTFMGCRRPCPTLSPGGAVRAGRSGPPSSSEVLGRAASHIPHIAHIAHITRATSYRSGVPREPGGLTGARREPRGPTGGRRGLRGLTGARRDLRGLTGARRDPGDLTGARRELGGLTGARPHPGGLNRARREPGGPNGACWGDQPSAPGTTSSWNAITGTSQEAGCAPPSSVPWTAW